MEFLCFFRNPLHLQRFAIDCIVSVRWERLARLIEEGISFHNGPHISGSDSSTRQDRRPNKVRSDDIKWQELLDKFRAVQARHEKARSRQPHSRTPPVDSAVILAGQPKRNPSLGNQGGVQPSHKKGGRSIHNFTQGIMGVGRSNLDAKGGATKRKG